MPSVQERPDSQLEECHLIDVRTPAEFSAAWIPGSTNVPLGDLSGSLDALRSQAAERPLLLVCRTANRAEKARQILEQAGITNTRVLAGGLEAWTAAGQSVATGQASGMSLERQVRIVAGTLVVVGVILSFAVHPLFSLLSGFIGAGLVFAGVTDTCGMGMVLSKMPWNRRSTPTACSAPLNH